MNETSLDEHVEWTVGIDSGSKEHVAHILDARCRSVGKHKFEHSGRGIGALVDWALKHGGDEPQHMAVATEAPHGPVVEGVLERGFSVYAMNPKQMAGFRSRTSPAGVKDDERDAWILAQTLRADTYAYRRVELGGALYVRMRDLSRMRQNIEKEIVRLTNMLWQQLHRYFPQMLGVGSMEEEWVRKLWKRAPSPQRAERLTERWVAGLLREHRITRTVAAEVLEALQAPAVPAAPGVVESAITQIEYALPRLALLEEQRKRCDRELEALLREMHENPASDQGGPPAPCAERGTLPAERGAGGPYACRPARRGARALPQRRGHHPLVPGSGCHGDLLHDWRGVGPDPPARLCRLARPRWHGSRDVPERYRALRQNALRVQPTTSQRHAQLGAQEPAQRPQLAHLLLRPASRRRTPRASTALGRRSVAAYTDCDAS